MQIKNYCINVRQGYYSRKILIKKVYTVRMAMMRLKTVASLRERAGLSVLRLYMIAIFFMKLA